jgi:hypothetical protein
VQHPYGRFTAAHGVPVNIPPDVALGIAGIREKVHPRNVSALRFPSRDAAERYHALTNTQRIWVGEWTGPEGGVLAVYDIAPLLTRATDTRRPDGIRYPRL